MNKLIGLCCILSCLAFTFQYQPHPSNQIKGTIQLKKIIQLKKDSSCKKKSDDNYVDPTEVMHSKDSMASLNHNIILSLHPLDFIPELSPTKKARITQKEQTFLPKVLPVTVGTSVNFMNEDEFFHNVQSEKRKDRINGGRRPPGIAFCQEIKRTGVISLMCDIHSHMNAVILSFDTPYFTRVQKDGSFQMDNLPDGRYRVEIFYPHCSNVMDEIKLEGGKTLTIAY